jgi:glycosyltransferase involved in cell wall biosynthesis
MNFASVQSATGKGLQLRNLISSPVARFQGYAPSPRSGPGTAGIVHGGSRRYLLWQQTSLPRLIRPWEPDVFLAPYNIAPLWLPRGVKLLLVLHDLILLEGFKASSARARLVNHYRRRMIPPSVTRSHAVITVSQFSRDQILKSFPGTRVTVLPCTIAESWFVEPKSLFERENSILLVTAPPPHKNAERALRAYGRYLQSAGPKAARLRIVGLAQQQEPFRKIVRELRVEEQVTFEPFVSTPVLQRLYRTAKAVLIPSLLEGFGIPVLEGMASGTPVLASAGSSLSEVGGEAIHPFDPYDVDSIANAMLEIMKHPPLWLDKVSKGRLQTRQFHPVVVRRRIDDFWLRLGAERSQGM